ncbi:unnamed protein product [Symbiodinium sp. CCMP2592]|nr:unnamed protein product [Symbiodinium sp. CCMP2592]CAE7421213.1 unnamed protein product [Symbiodinium sp. CCMP2592]CAE7527638.1 unnamed protein product [Symbiodinium sp. CCMP2592]
MADDSEHEDDRDVRLCTKTVVMYGKGEQWIPTQKNEEGMVWFSVNGRWDRGFTKFVFGKALDLRKDKDSRSLNSKFFDDLMTQRQTTFNEVIQKRLQSEDDDQEDTPPQNKKVFKSFKATAAKHQQYAPYYIDMQLPAIEEGGPTPTAKVLFEGLGSHTLWFELTEANLRHLKAGFVNSESKESVDWSSFMQVELLGGMEEKEGMWTSQSGELRWTKGKGWRILIKACASSGTRTKVPRSHPRKAGKPSTSTTRGSPAHCGWRTPLAWNTKSRHVYSLILNLSYMCFGRMWKWRWRWAPWF